MDLKDIDLNLLLVFNQLLIQKRVSAVAETLGQTQPGISNALNRLRKILGDDLFIRTSRGMEPTPFAVQLAEPISYALSTIHNTLNQRTVFEAATSTRKFTIGINDIGEIYFLPRLMAAMAKVAPHIAINTVRVTIPNLREEMESGHIDLAIGLLPQLKTGFFQRRLFEQNYVCMFRAGHVLDKGAITLAEFEHAEHIAVVAQGTGHARFDELMQKKGIQRHIKLMVPHFVAVGHILSKSDMVASVPERYAQQCVGPFGLRYVQHPVDFPKININLFWHAKFHKEPGNQWLRRMIFDVFSDAEAGMAAFDHEPVISG